ncbi:sigma 54-interacting transcriptional regulator [Nitrospira sp. M1]
MTSERFLDNHARSIAIAGLLFGVLGMVCGYGLTLLFPQVEVAAYDWHVKTISPATVDPSIILITLDEHDPASCGHHRWNSSIIASTIVALQKAGASVIAPAVHVDVPNSSECGDVLGNAHLLEATKQAGNVVYPSTIQPLFAKEAQATGWFMLTADEDGIFRGLSSKQIADNPKPLPFGLAIASAYKRGDSFHLLPQGLISFAGRWADQPFPTYTFSKIFELTQNGEDTKLARIVHEKIVLLFPVTQNTKMLGTPLESTAPLGFLHANLVNSALTDSWLTQSSWLSGLLRTMSVIMIIALLAAWRQDSWGWGAIGVVMLTYYAVTMGMFMDTGSVWPVVSPTFALMGTLAGITIWPLYQQRKNVREQVKDTSRQLTLMQEHFAKKELRVEQLEEELGEARGHIENTSQQFESLATTEDETRTRLREAEGEADEARQQLEQLQHELRDLRKVSPAHSDSKQSTFESDEQTLQEECARFGIFTCSPLIVKTFQELKKTAITNSPILILGETGTGKELFAHAAHQLSGRSQSPFISVNMAAIRPELFESELFGHVKGAFTGAISRRGFLETADRGSIFLDEIGELPLDLQAKLLRVLENGTFYRVGQSTPTEVDVRIITATNRDLSQAAAEGLYREDLYYRLRSLVFTLPPLRERGKEDMTLLAQHIIADLSRDHDRQPVQLSQGAMDAIHDYAWPGNVRELRQTLAQAVALADEGSLLTEDDLRLPQREREGTTVHTLNLDDKPENLGGKDEMARREDAFVLSTLRQHGFDMQATAKTLAWDRSTVTQRLKGLGFQALVDHDCDVHRAAVSIAGTSSLEKVAELKLKEYYRNLLSSTASYETAEQALANCRKRMRNIPERHFPAIETLIRQHFTNKNQAE